MSKLKHISLSKKEKTANNKKSVRKAATQPIQAAGKKKAKAKGIRNRASSIKVKILIPLLALTLVIIASGLINIQSMEKMQSSITQLTKSSLPTQSSLQTAIADFNDLQRLIYAHCLSEDKSYMEKCQSQAEELFDEIENALATYEAGIHSDEDQALIADFRKNYQMYTYTYQTAEHLSYSMMKKLAQSYIPNLMQNGADAMQEQLKSMQANIQSMIDEEIAAQRASYERAVIVTVTSTIVGIVIAILALLLINI